MDDKPPREVRFRHSGAEPSWPAPPIARVPTLPGISAGPDVGPREVRHEARISWVWKVAGVLCGCVAFGWAGHATMAAWSARWQTVDGSNVDRLRTEKLERDAAGEQLKVHDLERDLQQLRKEFDLYANQHPDVIQKKPR